MKETSFAKLFAEAQRRDAFWVADAIYTFTKELHELAEQKGLSRADLARLMGVSPAYITKIFRGNANFTIDTMVRLARRVGARLQLHLVTEESEASPFTCNGASEAAPPVPEPVTNAAKKRAPEPLPAEPTPAVRKIKVKPKTQPDLHHAEGE